jgi:hypothetical protein
MSKHNKHPNTQNNLRKMRIGVAASLASLGVAAGTAHAQPTQSETAPPAIAQTGGTPGAPAETPSGLSQFQEQLQEKVQAGVNALAKRVLHPSRHQHKSTQYFEDADGTKLVQTTVKIDAVTQYGSNRGGYEFTVIAPVSEDGLTPNLDDVNTITLNQGVKDEQGNVSPSTSVTIGKDPVTYAFELSGLYEPIKGGKQIMTASIASNSANLATGCQAVLGQMGTIVSLAHSDSGGPIGSLERPYNPANGATSLDPAN